MCPDAGRARLPISPSTSTTGKASSSRLRASALSWLGLRTLSAMAAPGMATGYPAPVAAPEPRYQACGSGRAGTQPAAQSRPDENPAMTATPAAAYALVQPLSEIGRAHD